MYNEELGMEDLQVPAREENYDLLVVERSSDQLGPPFQEPLVVDSSQRHAGGGLHGGGGREEGEGEKD
eukprot:712784-Hanusia_phi.AAC.1